HTASPGTATQATPPAPAHTASPGTATPATAPILSAADVSVIFDGRGRRGGATAVDGVNLDIAPGEIVAPGGESGCGKTTLARTLLGLERATSGQVRFADQPPDERVAWLPQAGAACAAGPDRFAEPQAHRLRGGRRRGADSPAVRRTRAGCRRAGSMRAAAARAVLRAVSARAIRRSAATGGHRRCACTRAEGARGRRASGVA